MSRGERLQQKFNSKKAIVDDYYEFISKLCGISVHNKKLNFVVAKKNVVVVVSP